jgi:hypothetical protein
MSIDLRMTTIFGRRRAASTARCRYDGAVNLPFDPPLAPMLSAAAAELPSGDGWQFEPKWDGFPTLRSIAARQSSHRWSYGHFIKIPTRRGDRRWRNPYALT